LTDEKYPHIQNRPRGGFLCLVVLAGLAHAVFVLPSQITVAARIDSDGTLRTDVVQDGVETVGVNAIRCLSPFESAAGELGIHDQI